MYRVLKCPPNVNTATDVESADVCPSSTDIHADVSVATAEQ